jgi:CRP-like cAMP-binding protein/glyoxylase-like metal-dependent hydrolase (beta-lactamase superfamily II)
VIYDGPVGTRFLLDRQGMSFDDVAAVILSHCHEDHMGAFVELVLAGHRPKVLTAEPIYRSALLKLSSALQLPEAEVSRFIDYQPVVPGQPLDFLGARFDFFYTVHAIPTVGVSVSLRDVGGVERRVQISGDTMHHEGLEAMRKEGVIDDDTFAQLRALVPEQKQEGALFFADVGESIIHGHPKDWQSNANRVLYYHCPDNDHTRSFGHEIAAPGESHTLVPAAKLHPALPGRLLRALAFLDLQDPGWLSTLLHCGRMRAVEAGTVLVQAGQPGDRVFSVIVTGSATVSFGPTRPPILLRPGEFFGAIELVDEAGRHNVTITAESPMELYDIDAAVFFDYVRESGLEESLAHLWQRRGQIETAALFARLDLATRNRIARAAVEERFAPGTHIVEQGEESDDFFLLLAGDVEMVSGGSVTATLSGGGPESFFGAASAVYPRRPRRSTVRARTEVCVLRLPGRLVRRLFANDMGVRYALSLALARPEG